MPKLMDSLQIWINLAQENCNLICTFSTVVYWVLHRVCTIVGGLPAGVSNNNVCRLKGERDRGGWVPSVWAQNKKMKRWVKKREGDKGKGAGVFLCSIMQSNFSQSLFIDERGKNRERERAESRQKGSENNSKCRSAGRTEGDRDEVRQQKNESLQMCIYQSEPRPDLLCVGVRLWTIHLAICFCSVNERGVNKTENG